MILLAVRPIAARFTSYLSDFLTTSDSTGMIPEGCPIRNTICPLVSLRENSWGIVPSILAATPVHMAPLPAYVLCITCMNISLPIRSTCWDLESRRGKFCRTQGVRPIPDEDDSGSLFLIAGDPLSGLRILQQSPE